MPLPWPTSACLPAHPLDFLNALRRAAGLGFTHVDLAARADDRPAEEREALADAGVLVGCAVLDAGAALRESDLSRRRAALDGLRRQVNDAALLGATQVCLRADRPGDGADRARLAEALALLADHAAGRMVCLGLEGEVLDWLEELGHPNLGFVLGPGTAGAEAAARRAGGRLVHVRVRRAGELTEVLQELGYRGVVAVEEWEPKVGNLHGQSKARAGG